MVPVLSSSSTSHVACRLDGAARHGEDVLLHQAVDARDADGREQAADGRRDQADEQRDEHRGREVHAREFAVRQQRHADEQEDDRQGGEQDRQRDFVGRLLAFRAFDETDHAVQKTLARVGRNADLDLVAQARACRP